MVDVLHNYLTSKMNRTIARYNFFSRKQSAEETLDAFVTALTNLSWSCELGDLRDSLVKDIMICNLAPNCHHLRDRLLQKDPASLQDAFNLVEQDYATVEPKLVSEHNVVVKTGQVLSIENAKQKGAVKRRNSRREKTRKNCCEDCGGSHEKHDCPVYAAEQCPERFEPASYLSMEVQVEGDTDGVKLAMDPSPVKLEATEIKMEHPSQPTKVPPGKRNFKCRYCDSVLSSQSELKAHKKTHSNKPYTCKDCGKGFRYKHHLTRHFRIHTGERPHMCSECGKRFIQESALYVHLRTHSGEKPYVCNYCAKSFRQKLYLVVHMRTHTKEKPHQCHYCGKCFSQKSALNVHVRCHTGETPYHCTECGKAFAYKVDYNTHLITHTGQTPHRCRDCGKSFSTKAVLKKHARKHTGERPFSCTMCTKAFSFKHHLVRHMRLHGEGDGPKLCIVGNPMRPLRKGFEGVIYKDD